MNFRGIELPPAYYQDEWVYIIHGDCREILPSIPDKGIDLVLTDPPYGIGKDGQKRTTGGHGGRKAYEFMGWDIERPSLETFKQIIRTSKAQVIWGGNYFADLLPAFGKWLVWDKGQRIKQSDGELAWTSYNGALRIYNLNRVELMLDNAKHPTQKPLKLMRWCIKQSPESQTILDPFMGSGSTLMAGKHLNRYCIGIEIEEKYCEIAAKRCCQSVMELNV